MSQSSALHDLAFDYITALVLMQRARRSAICWASHHLLQPLAQLDSTILLSLLLR